MKDFVAMSLYHLRVDEETGVTKLCYLLGKQFHTMYRIAEYDALVDLKLKGGRKRERE